MLATGSGDSRIVCTPGCVEPCMCVRWWVCVLLKLLALKRVQGHKITQMPCKHKLCLNLD